MPPVIKTGLTKSSVFQLDPLVFVNKKVGLPWLHSSNDRFLFIFSALLNWKGLKISSQSADRNIHLFYVKSFHVLQNELWH